MDINKAIRKQKKSYKRFMLAMSFIFFIVPGILYLSGRLTTFFITYMTIIEIMVIVAAIIKTDNEKLMYENDGEKIKIRNGIIGPHYNIVPDKVVIVHTENEGSEISLIMIMTSSFRNKKIKPIDSDFLRKHAYVSHEYNRMKKLYPESNYYFIIIKRGGYTKFRLLSDIYKSCVKASYTDDAIENIKKGRL